MVSDRPHGDLGPRQPRVQPGCVDGVKGQEWSGEVRDASDSEPTQALDAPIVVGHSIGGQLSSLLCGKAPDGGRRQRGAGAPGAVRSAPALSRPAAERRRIPRGVGDLPGQLAHGAAVGRRQALLAAGDGPGDDSLRQLVPSYQSDLLERPHLDVEAEARDRPTGWSGPSAHRSTGGWRASKYVSELTGALPVDCPISPKGEMAERPLESAGRPPLGTAPGTTALVPGHSRRRQDAESPLPERASE